MIHWADANLLMTTTDQAKVVVMSLLEELGLFPESEAEIRVVERPIEEGERGEYVRQTV